MKQNCTCAQRRASKQKLSWGMQQQLCKVILTVLMIKALRTLRAVVAIQYDLEEEALFVYFQNKSYDGIVSEPFKRENKARQCVSILQNPSLLLTDLI